MKVYLAITACCVALSLPGHVPAQENGKVDCVYVSSYHPGYEWNDGIENGLKKTLGNACRLEVIYLDTKRNPQPAWAQFKAKEARQRIEAMQPAIVLASDDNASRYLIQPYFRNHRIPFVFCGLNGNIEEYGFPYENVTGMKEVAALGPMIQSLRKIDKTARRGLFISSNVITEQMDLRTFQQVFQRHGIRLDGALVGDMREWSAAYLRGQTYDFIILANNAGIRNWDRREALRIIRERTRKLSITTYEWMMPYSALGFTKVAAEQGVWMGRVAKAILAGTPVQQIPIISNRRWDLWINPEIMSLADVPVPYYLYTRAKTYQ